MQDMASLYRLKRLALMKWSVFVIKKSIIVPRRQCPAWPSFWKAKTVVSSFLTSLSIWFLWDMGSMCYGDWLETGVLNIICCEELLFLPYWSELLAILYFMSKYVWSYSVSLAWGALDIWCTLLGLPTPTLNVKVQGRVPGCTQHYLWPYLLK